MGTTLWTYAVPYEFTFSVQYISFINYLVQKTQNWRKHEYIGVYKGKQLYIFEDFFDFHHTTSLFYQAKHLYVMFFRVKYVPPN